MVKKAIVSTVIFTLIIINLIIWPTLFSDFKEGNSAVSSEQSEGSIELDDESVDSESGLDEDFDSDLAGEDEGESGVEGNEDEDNASEIASKEKTFKILRIE